MKITVLSCLAVLVLHVMADDKVTLCGTALENAKKLLCSGADHVMKRKVPMKYDMEEQGILSERRFWNGRQGVGSRWERNKRGLVEECCLKPCSTDVLLSYC